MLAKVNHSDEDMQDIIYGMLASVMTDMVRPYLDEHEDRYTIKAEYRPSFLPDDMDDEYDAWSAEYDKKHGEELEQNVLAYYDAKGKAWAAYANDEDDKPLDTIMEIMQGLHEQGLSYETILRELSDRAYKAERM